MNIDENSENVKKNKKDIITVKGTVLEVLPGTTFKVKLQDYDKVILCHVSGKIRKFRIKIILNDLVTIEMNKSDPTKGRIILREKFNAPNSAPNKNQFNKPRKR